MVVGRSLTIVSNLLLVPLFLIHWDKTAYGEWLALSSAVAYLSTTDLGMNTAAINELTAAYARKDMARYHSIQSSASLFYVLFTGCFAMLCAVAFALLPFPQWLGLKSIPGPAARLIAWLLAVRILLQMLAYQICGIYRSIGRLSTTEWIWNLQFMLGIAATAWVLICGGSPLELAAWNIAPLIVVSALAWCVLGRTHPQLLPHLSDARLPAIKKLVNPSLGFGLIMVTAAVAFNGPILIASGILGGATIALLVSTRTLSNLVRQIVQILTSAIWPEITRLHATAARTEIQAAHRFICFVASVLCSAIAGTLWFEGEEIIQRWTGARLVPDVVLLHLFLVSIVFGAPWVASSLINMATNRNRRTAAFQAASALITVASSALLLPYAGARAIPIGVLIGEALGCYHFIVKDACKATGSNYSVFARRLWPMVLLLSLTAYAAAWLAHAVAIGPCPVRWIESTLLTLFGCGLVGWRLGASRNERQVVRRAIELTLSKLGNPVVAA